MKANCLTLLLLCLWCMPTAFSQNIGPRRPERFPSFIRFSETVNLSQRETLFQTHFKLEPNDELRLISRKRDPLGFVHERYQQYYQGVPVEGSMLTVHSRNGQIGMITGNYRKVKELNINAGINNAAALGNAMAHVGAKAYAWDLNTRASGPEGELVVVADPSGIDASRLAYKFDIYAVDPLYRAYVFVDAHSGAYFQENPRIHHTDVNASGSSLYNGNVDFVADYTGADYRLRQTSSGDGVETYSLNNWIDYSQASDILSPDLNFEVDPTAVQAHWGAEQTYQYFFDQHGRSSYDDAGTALQSFVHYDVAYVNAFWDGERMTYGDGDGLDYGPLVSLDIVGHEIAHGVTEYTADLIYSYESGALNESFSDIFGEAIEYFATGTNDWRMGTDIGINGSGAIRAMDDPNLFGDPDTYLGINWYYGSGDNGGVHFNSGVQNKWFYILAEGEQGVNDHGQEYEVSGIGIEKAAAIAYRNLAVYLFPSANYFNARSGAIQAAIDLYGEGSPEVEAVTAAWYAVGVGAEGDAVGYCPAAGEFPFDEWIGEVSIGDFSNPSGQSGYSDFTDLVINLEPGTEVDITLTPDFYSYPYEEYWRIWIDFNGDEDFNDAGELVFDSEYAMSTPVTGTISIPSDVGPDTRMRVAMKYIDPPEPCEFFYYGEVEDYTVSFGGGTSISLEIIDQQNVTCFGGSDGSATVEASGGSGAYTYLWDNGETTAVAVALSAGTHEVSVSDGTNEKVASVMIEQPEAISLALQRIDATDGNNGSITAMISGGTPGYERLWSNGSSSDQISDLAPGTYSLTVTDANGCTIIGSATIEEVVASYDIGITAVGGPSGEVCSDALNPVVTLQNFSNTQLTKAKIRYRVDNSEWKNFNWNGFLDVGASMLVTLPEVAIESGAHQFTVRTKKPNGVDDTNTSNDKLITTFDGKPYELNLTILLDDYPDETSWSLWNSEGEMIATGGPYDYEDMDETITESICVGDGSYNFAIYDYGWDGICCYSGEGYYELTDGTGNVMAMGGEFYEFEITNFIIGTTPDMLSLQIGHHQDVQCAGEENGAATAQAFGGVQPYTYEWSNGGTGPSISDLYSGSYAVTVTDAEGSVATVSTTILEPEYLDAYIYDYYDVDCGSTNNGSATMSVYGGTGEVTVTWIGPDGFTATGPTIEGLAGGIYFALATDANGCTMGDMIYIYDYNSTYYADLDGDGYGDPGATLRDCYVPDGYVANNLDCDDTNAAVHSLAIEICDGIDNDCDGEIDEDVPLQSFYFDADLDGYGDPSTEILACVQPLGYVGNGDDCEDGDAGINPGETEICDGIDNDCDGDIDEGCSSFDNLVNDSQPLNMLQGAGLTEADSSQMGTSMQRRLSLDIGSLSDPDIDMKVYPNPARDQLSISFEVPKDGQVNLQVTDLSGRTHKLHQWTLDRGRQEIQFDGSGLEPGTYLFRLLINEQQHTRKVIIMP